MVDPSITGFVDAQRRLRDKLGRDVRFFTPIANTYDPNLPAATFDPESGDPHDPMVRPIASGFASAMVRCSVVYAPLAAPNRDRQERDALGDSSKFNKDLIVDIDDRAVVEAADHFELDGETWRIVDTTPDGIGALQRIVVFGEAVG